MRIETTLGHEARLKEIARDIYSMARSAGMSHLDIMAETKRRIYGDHAYSKIPEWAKRGVRTVTDELFNGLYRPDISARQYERNIKAALNGNEPNPIAYLRWQLRVDGKFVTSEEVSDMRDAGDENVWQRVEGAHVWNHKPDKTFTPWENTFTSCASKSTPSDGGRR